MERAYPDRQSDLTRAGSIESATSSGPTAGAVDLIGQSPAFQHLMRHVTKMASAAAPVLIQGETGCGKELVARALHYLGPRSDKPFLPINCGAIPDSLIEAELFGHDRGAFTDAKHARQGVVTQANGGTLFLDEIDTLSPKAQITLLRFLQDFRYRPLGRSVELACDVRIIAAANRPLESAVADGGFRRDLLYRVNILVLAIPALRDRPGDAELLADHFVRKFAAKYNLGARRLHPETRRWMRTYDWPGNVRELENLVHRQLLLADDDEILYCGDRTLPVESGAVTDTFRSAKARAVAEFERTYLVRVLAETNGNVSSAARLAGKERRAFARLVKKHRIDTAQYRP